MAEYKRLKSADTVLALCFALLATTIDERFDTFLEIPPQKSGPDNRRGRTHTLRSPSIS
jgi:hypothetical protein